MTSSKENHAEGQILFIDRSSHEKKIEKVYGAQALELFYGSQKSPFKRIFGSILKNMITRLPFFSWGYGVLQKNPLSKKKIIPFIKEYEVDSSEFQDPTSFSSFNDFFIRKLKPEARPIVSGNNRAAIPADGRYFFYQDISTCDGFIVKGKKFDLAKLLQDNHIAQKYAKGSMVMARLCPVDYHRFHFPCDCLPGEPRLINGYLYSVNPVAIRKNLSIFTENKRMITKLRTETFGEILYIEIGATTVGSIYQTYTPGKQVKKGDEKGYFSFGGSSLILLFEPNTLFFDHDLIEASSMGLEIRCLMGQSMGKSLLDLLRN